MAPLRAKNLEAKTKALQGKAQTDPYLKMALDSIDPYASFGQSPEEWEASVMAKRNSLKNIAAAQGNQGGLAIGTVENGFEYQGGDPSLPESWSKL